MIPMSYSYKYSVSYKNTEIGRSESIISVLIVLIASLITMADIVKKCGELTHTIRA